MPPYKTANKNYADTLSYSNDAFKYTTYAQDAIFKGDTFTFSRRYTITSGSSLYFVVDYSTYIPHRRDQDGTIVIEPGHWTATKTPVNVNFWVNGDYTSATTFKASNANQTYSVKLESGITFYEGATGTDKGTQIDNLQYTIGGDSPGVTGGGGS